MHALIPFPVIGVTPVMDPVGGGLKITDPFLLTLAAYIAITVVGEICVALHMVAGIIFGDLGLLMLGLGRGEYSA